MDPAQFDPATLEPLISLLVSAIIGWILKILLGGA